jgi:predicted nucleic acid-binding protein
LIVLDASLIVEWLAEPHPSVPMETFEALLEIPVLVPSHWPLEVSNTLLPNLRTNKLSVEGLHGLIDRLDVFDIRVQPPLEVDEIGPMAQFAVTHDLTTYDAAYVQLALHHRATLATLDRAMRTAATKLNIPLLPAVAP